MSRSSRFCFPHVLASFLLQAHPATLCDTSWLSTHLGLVGIWPSAVRGCHGCIQTHDKSLLVYWGFTVSHCCTVQSHLLVRLTGQSPNAINISALHCMTWSELFKSRKSRWYQHEHTDNRRYLAFECGFIQLRVYFPPHRAIWLCYYCNLLYWAFLHLSHFVVGCV